jgi:hypothetical protein
VILADTCLIIPFLPSFLSFSFCLVIFFFLAFISQAVPDIEAPDKNCRAWDLIRKGFNPGCPAKLPPDDWSAALKMFDSFLAPGLTLVHVVGAPGPAGSVRFNGLLDEEMNEIQNLLANDATVFGPRLSFFVRRTTKSDDITTMHYAWALVAQPERMVLWFSGHGQSSAARHAVEGAESNLVVGGSALCLEPLARSLLVCRARVTLVILDACHSSGFFGSKVFPGLVVVPAAGIIDEVNFFLSRDVIIPLLKGKLPSARCKECENLVTYSSELSLKLFLDYVMHFVSTEHHQGQVVCHAVPLSPSCFSFSVCQSVSCMPPQ